MTTRPGNAERARQRGFTLIEVLAALVIVALGMMGVIEAVTQSARNGTYLREKTLAHWIAMNVLTEQRLQTSQPGVGVTTGDVTYAGQNWKWKMTVTQTQVESMRRMDVNVRMADAPEGTSLVTVSGFYGTAVAPAGSSIVMWAGTGGTGPGGPQQGGQQGGGGKNPTPPGLPTDNEN